MFLRSPVTIPDFCAGRAGHPGFHVMFPALTWPGSAPPESGQVVKRLLMKKGAEIGKEP
jgi:hypothetical protein